jgi:hypothetical protein
MLVVNKFWTRVSVNSSKTLLKLNWRRKRSLKLTCSYSIGCFHERRIPFRVNNDSSKEKQNSRNDLENGETRSKPGRGVKGTETDHMGEFMHIGSCSI